MLNKMHVWIQLYNKDFSGGSDGKASAYNAGRPRFNPWVRKILWRRKWQPTPALLPGKSHGWRSVVGYSPWGRKESDTTEQLHIQQGNHLKELHIKIKKNVFKELSLSEVYQICTQGLCKPDFCRHGVGHTNTNLSSLFMHQLAHPPLNNKIPLHT